MIINQHEILHQIHCNKKGSYKSAMVWCLCSRISTVKKSYLNCSSNLLFQIPVPFNILWMNWGGIQTLNICYWDLKKLRFFATSFNMFSVIFIIGSCNLGLYLLNFKLNSNNYKIDRAHCFRKVLILPKMGVGAILGPKSIFLFFLKSVS